MIVGSSSSTLPRPKLVRLRPIPQRSRSVNDLSQCWHNPARTRGPYGMSCQPHCTAHQQDEWKPPPLHIPPTLPHTAKHGSEAAGGRSHPHCTPGTQQEDGKVAPPSQRSDLAPIPRAWRGKITECSSLSVTRGMRNTGDISLTARGREIVQNVLLCGQSSIYSLGKRF